MSLPRRVVHSATSMSHPQLFDDSSYNNYEKSRDNNLVLFDINMSAMLGSFHQLQYVSAYISETLENLILLSEDMHDRIELLAVRKLTLFNQMSQFESRVVSIELNEFGHSGFIAKNKFLPHRESYVPTVLSRGTNSGEVMAQYDIIQPLPPFWKLVPVTQQDTTIFYSNPGKVHMNV